MLYKDFKGMKLSALGLGCMRFPELEDGSVDEAATEEMVDYAIRNGVNYFDTAWMYHKGKSEELIGRLLSKYPRDSYYLCTKFPGFDETKMDKVEETFEEQLRRTGAGYFDFYFLHNVCERNSEAYADEKYGVMAYLRKQKEAGRIRHLGFSSHGSPENLRAFLDKCGADMELCQIQLNYIDWTLQRAEEKVELLSERGIPVWVMEPVRGGELAKLPPEQEEVLRRLRPDEDPAAWCFRFIQSLPEVCVTLSGMSSLEQVKANIATFSEEKPLNMTETLALLSAAKEMMARKTLPCTGCRYCTEYCPMELNIPGLISLYNDVAYSGESFVAATQVNAMPEDKRPSACRGCGICETVCPQGIKITEMMRDFGEKLKKKE